MASVEPAFSIAIIGSGIGGIALAIGLLKQNVPCTIFESAPRFDAVGAGIGLGPNALRAMELMDEKFAKMYDDIKVGNTSPDKLHEQFGIMGAREGFPYGGSVGHPDFTRSSAHRKDLLEVMESLIPDGTVVFNKRVSSIDQIGQKVSLTFSDGEVVKFDAVIGCDGIKGMSRAAVLQSRYPEQVPAKYCHTYVYRGIAPMEEAKKRIGNLAADAKWFMNEGRGVAMYPISRGTEVNMVVFIHDAKPWEGEQSAREISREEMVSEYETFDRGLKRLLSDYTKPMKWPLFHHYDTPTYYNGRICLLGDSAHASSPSQAAGAGQGLEDALILSRILGLAKNADQLEHAFQVYDSIRQPRAQQVVQQSLEVLIAYFLADPEIGHDMQKLTDDANMRLPLIWWHDLDTDVKTAEDRFKALTAGMKAEPAADISSVELQTLVV